MPIPAIPSMAWMPTTLRRPRRLAPRPIASISAASSARRPVKAAVSRRQAPGRRCRERSGVPSPLSWRPAHPPGDAAGRCDEQLACLPVQAERGGQQQRGVLVGGAVDSSFQVTTARGLTPAASASSSWVSLASARSCRSNPAKEIARCPATAHTPPRTPAPRPPARHWQHACPTQYADLLIPAIPAAAFTGTLPQRAPPLPRPPPPGLTHADRRRSPPSGGPGDLGELSRGSSRVVKPQVTGDGGIRRDGPLPPPSTGRSRRQGSRP